MDWVDKTEFQMKSTIHSHYMLCIHDLSMNEYAVAEMTSAIYTSKWASTSKRAGYLKTLVTEYIH